MVKAETRRKTPRLPKQIEAAVGAAEDKKALDLIVLDLRKTGGFTDYFVICSGGNPRQLRGIAVVGPGPDVDVPSPGMAESKESGHRLERALAGGFEVLPAKWQAAIVKAEQQRPKLRVVSGD